MAATDIDQVVAALDDVVDDCHERGDRRGYFAALYRNVTMQIRDDIALGGVFDDDARMERLGVTFANRYLTAYDAAQRGEPCGLAWHAAFRQADSRRYVIVQHLLAGINVHINLDLGVATAEVAPGASLARLRDDFDRINEVLADMVAGVLLEVGRLSPWIGLADRIGGRRGDNIINFSIDAARREAWDLAEQLAPPGDRSVLIERRDRAVERFGRLIVHPGWMASALLLVVKTREVKDVRRVIDALARRPRPPGL